MRRGEVVKRLDANYNKPEYRLNEQNLLAVWPDAGRLDSYADVVCGPFGTEITSKDYKETGVPLLRISNITNEGTIDETDLVFLSEEKAKSLRSTQVKPGDVVISQRGTLGIPAIVPDSYPVWNISANLIAIKDLKKISGSFVQFYLSTKVGGRQVERCQSGQVQGKITTEDIASILIPKTPSEKQLVADLEAAREARKRKLAEADALLAGIDGFLLKKLGLRLPEKEGRWTYAVRLKTINTNRLDSHFHKPFFRKTEEAIRSLKFKLAELSALLQMPPLNGVDARDYLDTGQRYLRVQNVRPYELLMDDVKYVSSDSKKDVALKNGDVLLTRKGTFGVAASVPKEVEDCLISSEIILLRLSPDAACLSEYLVTWLNSSAAKILLDRYKTGGIMGHITQDVVSAFPVPVPPMETQQAIAAEITRRREEARRLRVEAAKEWEGAKGRFEQALLG